MESGAALRPCGARGTETTGGFELATRLVEEGYVLLPGVLDAGRLAAVRDAVDRLLRTVLDPTRAGRTSRTVFPRDLFRGDPVVGALGREPLVVGCVEHLLNDAVRADEITVRNPPRAQGQQRLHEEGLGEFLPGEDRLAQALFYLDDVSVANGPTRVVPRSHRNGAVPPPRYGDPVEVHPREVRIPASAGDVLVMSGHLWHGGTANRSGAPRRTVIVTFRRASDPRGLTCARPEAVAGV